MATHYFLINGRTYSILQIIPVPMDEFPFCTTR